MICHFIENVVFVVGCVTYHQRVQNHTQKGFAAMSVISRMLYQQLNNKVKKQGEKDNE